VGLEGGGDWVSVPEKRGGGSEAGFTLLEVMIASIILGLVTGVAMFALIGGNQTLSEGMSRARVDTSVERMMAMITEDLREGGLSTLSLAAGSSATTISFQKVTGFNGNGNQAPSYGPTITYAWSLAGAPAYAVPEAQNGVDDNGNGLVDEGMLSRTEGSSGARVVATDLLSQSMPLSDGTWTTAGAIGLGTIILVNPLFPGETSQGFLFTRAASPNDAKITITITAAGRLPDKTIYARQMTESVLVRNN